MRTLKLTIAIIVAAVQSISAQYYTKDMETRYGFEISQFTSASGFKAGSEAHFTVRPSLRSQVGFGIYFDSEHQRISGVTITHKRMLRSYKINQNPVFEPLFFYNFIYRKSNLPELRGDGTLGSMSTYTSMEHHIGLGCNINILPKLFLQGEAGYGLYLGSIKKPSAPDPITNEVKGTNGWGSIMKFGIGIRL
jgi:hypothetical protein